MITRKLSSRMIDISSFILNIFGEKRFAKAMKSSKVLNCAQDRILTDKFVDYREKLFNFWHENKLDAIICPVFGCPPIKFDLVDPLTLFAVYTYIWNILNCPAGVVPVTRIREDE